MHVQQALLRAFGVVRVEGLQACLLLELPLRWALRTLETAVSCFDCLLFFTSGEFERCFRLLLLFLLDWLNFSLLPFNYLLFFAILWCGVVDIGNDVLFLLFNGLFLVLWQRQRLDYVQAFVYEFATLFPLYDFKLLLLIVFLFVHHHGRILFGNAAQAVPKVDVSVLLD